MAIWADGIELSSRALFALDLEAAATSLVARPFRNARELADILNVSSSRGEKGSSSAEEERDNLRVGVGLGSVGAMILDGPALLDGRLLLTAVADGICFALRVEKEGGEGGEGW